MPAPSSAPSNAALDTVLNGAPVLNAVTGGCGTEPTTLPFASAGPPDAAWPEAASPPPGVPPPKPPPDPPVLPGDDVRGPAARDSGVVGPATNPPANPGCDGGATCGRTVPRPS